MKLKSRKDSEGKRWYRLNEEVINNPTRQQVLACVETKLSQPKEEIDWDAAINEAHGVETENQPQTQSEQGLEGTAPSPQILYTNQLEGAVNNLESQGVVQELAVGEKIDRSQIASTGVEPPAARSWRWSDLPLIKSVLKWVDRGEQVRLLSLEPDGRCQVQSLLSGLVTNTRVDQLMPLSG